MKLMKRITLLTLALALLLGLTACGASGPDMPMEVTVNGKTIVIGQTTTGEMKGWGWEVEFTGSQNEIRSDAKYVSCHYHIKVDGGGAGKEFWVSVYVPFQKNMNGSYVDLSAEEKVSTTNGVVYRVQVRKSAGEDLSISYNGTDLQAITWETAEGWGAKVEDDGYGRRSGELAAAQGTLSFEKSYTSDDLNELVVVMDSNSFAKLQK